MKDDIFAIPNRRLEVAHRKLLRKIAKPSRNTDYHKVIDLLQEECDRFPAESMAWPAVLKRKGEAVEIQIKIVNVLSRPDSAKYQTSLRYYGRPPAVTSHRRIIEGDHMELAEKGLAIIRATKAIAEILTVLEQTKCSEEDTSS